MIVVFVVPALKNIGPTRQLMMLVKGLLKKNKDVHIVTFQRSSSDNEKKEEFINIGASVHEFQRYKGSVLLNVFQLRRLVQELKVDIIHSHLFYADLVTALALKGRKTICSLRSVPIEELTLKYGVIKGFLISLIHLWSIKRMHVKIACSDTVMQYYTSKKIVAGLIHNALPSSLEKLYNSQRAKSFKLGARRALNVPENALLAIMVGSLDERKNPNFVVELIKKVTEYFPDAYLLVVGDGELRNQSASTAKLHPQIRFEGFVSDVTIYYQAADIILSSSMSEGLPNSVIEAIGSNTISLISDIPQHRELQMLCPELIETLPCTLELNGDIFDRWLSRLIYYFENCKNDSVLKQVSLPRVLKEQTMVLMYEARYQDIMDDEYNK